MVYGWWTEWPTQSPGLHTLAYLGAVRLKWYEKLGQTFFVVLEISSETENMAPTGFEDPVSVWFRELPVRREGAERIRRCISWGFHVSGCEQELCYARLVF
jgi:hypothetical protein